MTHPLVTLARYFRFVREIGGANKGLWVGLFQRYTGNAPGDSWCASFVCFLLGILYQGKSPLTKSASCAELLADAICKNYVVNIPMPGDLFFYLDANGHAHHVGIVTATGPLIAIAGNTSEDGASSNGDGVYEHGIGSARNAYVRLPLPK